MLDIQLLRNDIDGVAAQLARRGYDLNVSAFNELDSQRKNLQTQAQDLQAKRNATSKQIGIAKSKGEDVSAILATVANLGDELKQAEDAYQVVQNQLDQWMLTIPNLPHDSVPTGKDEQDNIEVRKVGTPRSFDFEIKDHVDVGAPLGLDFDTGAALSGARFTVLKGQIAQLHRALAQFMLNTHTNEHGYLEHYTPYIVNPNVLFGTGQLPKFADDMFKVVRGGDDDAKDQYLISTAEITLTNTVRESLLKAAELPLKMTAHSPCFR